MKALRIAEDPSSGSLVQCSAKNYKNDSIVSVDMDVVGVMAAFIQSLVFSLEGRARQEPEPSHVTGMALAHCILGKFLGVDCHCFPPPLDVPTLAARCFRPQRRERS